MEAIIPRPKANKIKLSSSKGKLRTNPEDKNKAVMIIKLPVEILVPIIRSKGTLWTRNLKEKKVSNNQ